MRALIVLVLIVGAVGAVLFTGRSETVTVVTPGPVANAPAPAANSGGPVVLAPVKIVLECEDALTLDAKSPVNGVTVIEKKTESHGKPVTFLNIPDKWIEQCGMDKLKDQAGKLPGNATYSFTVPRDDTYFLNLRAKWFDSCGNSVWVKINDGVYHNLEDENGKLGEKSFKWAWHTLMREGRPLGVTLKAGTHTLHVAVREDGPQLDQWLISSDATPPAGDAPLSGK